MSKTELRPNVLAQWAKARGFEIAGEGAQMLIQDVYGTGIPVRAVFFDKPEICWLQVELSDVVAESRFREVSYAISLLNASAFLGSWNLKTSTGKMHYKVTTLSGAEYSADHIDTLVKAVVLTVMQTGPKLQRVANDGMAAESVRG